MTRNLNLTHEGETRLTHTILGQRRKTLFRQNSEISRNGTVGSFKKYFCIYPTDRLTVANADLQFVYIYKIVWKIEMDIFEGRQGDLSWVSKQRALFLHLNLLLSNVTRNIRWIMWLTLSCSHSSCLERKERLISATESSLSSTLSDTEFSDSDWLSPESSTAIQDTLWLKHKQGQDPDIRILFF